MTNTPSPESYSPEVENRYVTALQSEAAKLVEVQESALEASEMDEHREDARAILITELGELTNAAKSGAEDYQATDVLSIIALAVAITSPNLDEDAWIRYEDHGNEYYDVLAISGGYGESTMNIPVPFVNHKFLGALREQMEKNGNPMENVDGGVHDRNFEVNLNKKKQSAFDVYTAIGEFSKVAKIERFIGVVYDPHTEVGKERIRGVVTLINQCREAVDKEGGIEALVEQRTAALNTLYGDEYEYDEEAVSDFERDLVQYLDSLNS